MLKCILYGLSGQFLGTVTLPGTRRFPGTISVPYTPADAVPGVAPQRRVFRLADLLGTYDETEPEPYHVVTTIDPGTPDDDVRNPPTEPPVVIAVEKPAPTGVI